MENEREGSLLTDWRVRGFIGCGMVAGFLIAALIFGKPGDLAPNWGDIPTWLAVVVATVGGGIALSQFRSQREVLQRDALDRRRAQAVRVFIGLRNYPGDGDLVRPSARNASDFPIFEAKLWYISLDRPHVIEWDPEGYKGTMLPREERRGPRRFRSEEALRHTILTFRDANNVYWVRMPGGVLEEEPTAPDFESVRAAFARLPARLGPIDDAAEWDSGDAGRPISGPGNEVGRG